MAFSGVMYSTSNMPFSASLLAELFVWVLPRYSDFTPFCFKLITCFVKLKSTARLLVRMEKGKPRREEHQGYCTEHSSFQTYLVLHQGQKRAYNNSCLLCNQWGYLIAARKGFAKIEW